jgi:hypothetical protein
MLPETEGINKKVINYIIPWKGFRIPVIYLLIEILKILLECFLYVLLIDSRVKISLLRGDNIKSKTKSLAKFFSIAFRQE